MGAFAGTLTMTCYYVQGEIPEDFRESFIAALDKHRFKDINVDLDHEESIGWVTAQDPFDSEFELNKVLWGSYLVCALRHDIIRLPVTAFKMHLRKAADEYRKKTGKEKLSKGEMEEVKERLERQLRKKALPNIKTHDVVWNMDRGVLWLWTTNKKVNEQFLDIFNETFGLVLHEKNPYSQVEKMGFDADVLKRVTEIEPAAMSAPPGEPKRGRKKSAA
ncbi:MAG: recombination-associated protein RdgC [Deltaproteobacteria bacterium]|nr:recombination-associated protein RdgC [Deltaproteobacteria bacterium]